MANFFKEAAQSAAQLASQTSNEDRGMFDNALTGLLGSLGSHKPAEPHEIQQAQDNYQQLVDNPTQPATPEVVGNAAAVQAMQENEKASGGTLSTLIGFAMAIAAKLFGLSNGATASNDDKQSAVQQAAMMAFKLYMGQKAGGAQASGVSSLLNFAMNMGGGGGGNQQQASGLGQIGNLMGAFIGGGNQSQQQASGVAGLLSKLL
ncbi:hypothetical protein K501DRAFT_268938 [Backusella circina FSU 941]|nr:hypothetical protein K501DRAFT_268938 [Backusella circina FSU 941]